MNNINIILDKVSKLYKINIVNGKGNLIGNSTNQIYEVQDNDKFYIIRITEKATKYLPYYESELNFVNYLAKNNVNVSKAILSLSLKKHLVIWLQ